MHTETIVTHQQRVDAERALPALVSTTRTRWLVRASASLTLAFTLAGCGVDDRALKTGEGVSGGSVSGGSAGVAGGGASDPGAVDPGAIPRCIYDGAVEPVCETLVENPGFSANVAAWSAEHAGAISEEWAEVDAYESESSGSLVVRNENFKNDEEAKGGLAPGGAKQCLPAVGDRSYYLAGDIFVPGGQGDGWQGETFESAATLSIFFYPAADCESETRGNYTTPTVALTDSWVHVSGSVTSPAGTQSMAVRLATLKPFRQFTFAAHFDNVLVRER